MKTIIALLLLCATHLCGQTNQPPGPPEFRTNLLVRVSTNHFRIPESVWTNNFVWLTNDLPRWSVTNISFDDGYIKLYKEDAWIHHFPANDCALTNTINTLVTSGEFCRVRGHVWGFHSHTNQTNPSLIGCRECKVCSKHQAQYATEWK